MIKQVAVLGSTGSIGTQTLDVIARSSGLSIIALTANKNITLLEKQARRFKPKYVAVFDESLYPDLKASLADTDITVLSGLSGIKEIAALPEADIIVSAIVGIAGLLPTLEGINAGKTIALANKETLVTAGKLVTERARVCQSQILPVDSEHSAVFQCLNGRKDFLKRIILTASGGPFYGMGRDELECVTKLDALKHPNWSMGQKISVDSATLMNKGLEIIEAKWLFDVEDSKIDVVVHPQSVIHSMVEFTDGSILAQMGEADMRTPIAVALYYPEREQKNTPPFDFLAHSELTFDVPDEQTFRCLFLAKEALRIGGTMPCFLNGANEMAVQLFLEEKIPFLKIPDLIEKAMEAYQPVSCYEIGDILETDAYARSCVLNQLRR